MIYIMRHGQSEANGKRIIAGHQNSPLSMLGRQQATEAGRRLQHTLRIDRIISSPMRRARQTAELIAHQINFNTAHITILQQLEERHLGELEGKHYDDTPYGSGNVEDAEGVAGIEPIDDFYKRVYSTYAIITKMPPELNVLIVCHNGVGRMLQVIAKHGQPIDMYKQPRLQNTALYPLKASLF